MRARGPMIGFMWIATDPSPLKDIGPALMEQLPQKTFLKACLLNEDYRQTSRIFTLRVPGNVAEDPRLVQLGDETLLLYNDEASPGERKMYLGRLSVGRSIRLDRRSCVQLKADFDERAREKNWIAFVHDGKLFLSYEIDPHVVLSVDPKSGACRR